MILERFFAFKLSYHNKTYSKGMCVLKAPMVELLVQPLYQPHAQISGPLMIGHVIQQHPKHLSGTNQLIELKGRYTHVPHGMAYQAHPCARKRLA